MSEPVGWKLQDERSSDSLIQTRIQILLCQGGHLFQFQRGAAFLPFTVWMGLLHRLRDQRRVAAICIQKPKQLPADLCLDGGAVKAFLAIVAPIQAQIRQGLMLKQRNEFIIKVMSEARIQVRE
ncbi:MAG: hypothetical protein WCJ76_00600 [Comamonadaceae bacterium]